MCVTCDRDTHTLTFVTQGGRATSYGPYTQQAQRRGIRECLCSITDVSVIRATCPLHKQTFSNSAPLHLQCVRTMHARYLCFIRSYRNTDWINYFHSSPSVQSSEKVCVRYMRHWKRVRMVAENKQLKYISWKNIENLRQCHLDA